VSQVYLQPGDIVICQERRSPSGPCSFGAFGEVSQTAAATYAEALRLTKALAVRHSVDVWTTYRVRWADTEPQTFRRLATHRLQTQANALTRGPL